MSLSEKEWKEKIEKFIENLTSQKVIDNYKNMKGNVWSRLDVFKFVLRKELLDKKETEK